MLTILTELKSYDVRGADADIGRLDDIVFPDNEWVVRYVVVDMEDLAREALLLAAYLGRLDRRTHTLSADVSLEAVANTPPLDRSQPLTRHEEQELHDLYGWPVYWWETEEEIVPMNEPLEEEEATDRPEREEGERLIQEELEGPELLFAADLIGVYGIEAEGDEVGRLRDLVIDDETWTIPYVVIDRTSRADQTLLSTDYVEVIDLEARRLHVSIPLDALANGPVFRAEDPITPELAQSLREYYDQYAR